MNKNENAIMIQQQDATTHLLEWPNSGTQTTPNAGENVV